MVERVVLNAPHRKERGTKMKRDRLFGSVFMRLTAYVAMAFACAGSAWGEGNTIPRPRLNPDFIRWQRRQNNTKHQVNAHAVTNTQKRVTRLLASPLGTDAELISLPEGLTPTMIDFSYLNSLNSVNVGSVSGTVPACHDPRDLTPVRHQDPQDTGIGTCWAQASVGSMETWLVLNGYGQNQFSVRNIVNREGWDSNSWYGGNFIRSSAYLLRWDGPVWENDDPYTNRNGIVNYSFDSPAISPAYHVQQTRLVPARTGALDNDLLKKAILEYGGLYATMKLYSPYYTGTSMLIPYWSNTGAYYCPEKGAGHAVTLVGWDDNYPKDNFNADCRPVGNGAWIVKDSYGVELPRDNGYIYVSYYDTTFAYTESCAFPLIESKDNYGTVYQYDEFGQIAEWGIPANSTQIYTSGYGANIFTANKTEELVAVGFYATVPKATYKIRIYTGCSASNPSSGVLALEQSGTVDDYAGFYTMPLKSAVAIARGQRFSVVVWLSTPGAAPLSLEIAVDGYTSNATANVGESFFSMNGSEWYDFTPNANLTYGIPANFCCKAYTKSATAPKPTLSSIAISGVASLTSGQSAQFSCEAIYTDQSKKDISPTWSIARAGQAYATVSASGLVTAKEVSDQQTVTVQASYSEDGVTKTATWGMFVTIAAPSAPTDVTATQGTEASCVRVNWTAPNGATEYAVYRAMANNSNNAQYLETVTVPKFNDTSTVPGVDYWYFIKAKNSSGVSGFSAGANGWRKLSPPESVTASDTLLDKVALEWSGVEGATHYRIYRAESMDGTKTAIGNWQTTTAFDDTTATAGVTYYYFIVAAVDASGNRPSDYSIVEDGMRAVPVTIDRLEIKGDATINSGAHADYTADAIYTDGHKVESVTPDSWEIVGDGASVVGCRVSAAAVTENKTVVLKATYADGGKTARGEKQITIAAVKPVAPRNVAATVAAQGITLTWSAVAGASAYRVYRTGRTGVSPVQECIGTVAGTTFTDNAAMPGTTYDYTVSASNGAGEGPQSSPAVTATVPLPAPTGVTATTDRTDGVLVDWRRVWDNAPYQNGEYYFRVARAASESGAKTELGTWTTGTSYLDTSATAETAYWYFVRAATSSGGANASDWSAGVVGRVVPNAPQLLSISISGPDRVSASGTAMYSCTAAYDDNTTESVSPSWSASGTATIDANGRLTASAVTADAIVTVTAAFGGKSATKDVKVQAPVQASASVSNVRVTPRWPFSTLVDIDYTLATTPSGTRALVTLSGQDNDHNVPMAARTLTGDGVSCPVASGSYRITWDVGADHPSFHANSFDVTLEAVPYVISSPANFTASLGTSTRAVELSWDAVDEATGYEIWRSALPSSATASNIVVVADGTTYSDIGATAMQPYFYWIKTVTAYGTGDFGDYVYGYRLPPIAGTVVIDANGGTADMESMSYTVGEPYGELPTATRPGYSFVGWYTAGEGGDEVTSATLASDQITTLYAHWRPNVYAIRFDANGGDGSMSDMLVSFGVATNLTASAFVRDGCLFAGWTLSPTGAVAYADRAGITPTTNMTLYASWTITLQYALDNDGLSFTTGGNAEWLGVFDASAVNGSVARSGAISHSQSTWLRTTVSGKGTLAYRCKTSCESSFDRLTLYIDGRQYGTASGNGSGFNTFSYSVTNSGTHTVTWTYSKDSSVSQGDDCVWIDSVTWTPILFSASAGTSTDGIELEWIPVANVTTYLVWRSETTNRADAVVLNTAAANATRLEDTSVTPGVQYRYWLQAIKTTGAVVDVGTVVVGWRNFTAPTNFTVTEGVYTNRVVMSFDAVDGAMFYEFYMSQTNNFATAQYIGYISSTNNLVTASYAAMDAGIRYYFWVRALGVIPNGEYYSLLGYGEMSAPASGYIKKCYELSFNANGGEGYMPQQDVVIGTSTNLSENAFSRNGYLFLGWATTTSGSVMYLNGASVTPVSDMTLYAVWEAMAPAWVSATDGTSSNEIVVTWASVSSASSYEIWRSSSSNSDTATRIATVPSTSYNDTSTVGGAYYYYWVKSICDGVKSELSVACDRGYRKTPTPSVHVAAQTSGVTNLVVSWNAVVGATSYRLYRSTDKSTLGNYLTTQTGVSYVDANVVENRRYYYSVQAISALDASGYGMNSGYWGIYPHDSNLDLAALRSLLTKMDTSGDKVLSNAEFGRAMTQASTADLDGNTSVISDSELTVLGCIYGINNASTIYRVMQGYTTGYSDSDAYKLERTNELIANILTGNSVQNTISLTTDITASATQSDIEINYRPGFALGSDKVGVVFRSDCAYPIGVLGSVRQTSSSTDGTYPDLAELLKRLVKPASQMHYYCYDATAIKGRVYTYYVRIYSYNGAMSPMSITVTGSW